MTKNKCPKCGKEIGKHPSLSREDKKTIICGRCGAIQYMNYFNTGRWK